MEVCTCATPYYVQTVDSQAEQDYDIVDDRDGIYRA